MRRTPRSRSNEAVFLSDGDSSNHLDEGVSQVSRLVPPRTFRPATPIQPQEACWRINGFPALILIWTVEQWEHLEDRPEDAQYYPCGVWCALRML
ncbi:hypothetical protein BH23PLA1_BH23PLA1_17760 [soil metagenome]